MKKLTSKNLLSLEDYEKQREQIKADLLLHKKNRSIMIGKNILLLFEDYETIKHQVQEMLRIEKIFKETEINDEISAYTQLIPDGDNLKATMLIMYPDVSERKIMLNRLNGIENNIYLQIDDIDKIFAVSDEDLERTKDGKTSAVHFLRFQLDKSIVEKFKSSNNILLGVEHENYTYNMKINNEVKNALVSDFE
ncbi:MAG: DUF3501 family protein [Gammaproteobacteria bacterium]|jgi:hypothetical protein|nr:DUF3501 family protein [Gammaproteobacteria bacterium]MBT4462858.1 DUF3501 family protein [Gammaproteobacteria bacterium]MBT4655127.1 DUF3501 family protein [Gammaproteobacteria bacterium]MBT5116713.1 DUF3501 family protein [Gammaproteobacteria bacterium]MBT5761811.1 DUF3501 family protein [Gammaproteobacteria bacterium]